MKESDNKIVAAWLFSGCLLIFLMVIIGGITRLTGSGLSITEWKPIMGAVPPLNENEWQTAFEKYKQIPQYTKVNFDFTLADFKSIFWWEYIHRLLGRLIGIVFIVPFIWFYIKGMLSKSTTKKALFLFLLGGLQGVIGWLMVKSGLTDRTSVSHIRLAIHLLTAFITFGFTFYFALELIAGRLRSSVSNFLTRLIDIILFTVTAQLIYGAFVAGLHAGKIYNTFPLMNGRVVPEGLFFLQPGWLNFFDNQVMVQFIHRCLAMIILLLSGTLYYQHIKGKIPTNGIFFFLSAVTLQIVLGIITLLTSAEITMALLHQAGAFILFASVVYLKFVYTTKKELVS